MQRSAMGKAVDMSAIVTRNEKVRAVGNMGVNARGDVIDSLGRIVQGGTKRVKDSYNNTLDESNNDEPTMTLQPNSSGLKEDVQPVFSEEEQKFLEDIDDTFVKPEEEIVETKGKKK
jgi:hypothetical protein